MIRFAVTCLPVGVFQGSEIGLDLVAFMWSRREFATESGSGTSRSLRPLGRAKTRRLPTIFNWRTTWITRLVKSISSTARARISPWRRPQPAARSTAIAYRDARFARMDWTCSVVQGTTFVVAGDGGFGGRGWH